MSRRRKDRGDDEGRHGQESAAGETSDDHARSSVARARMRVEARLMALPGVVSVGVGYDESGTEAIVVGIAGSEPESLAVPQDVDGVRIVVRQVGAYRAEAPDGDADAEPDPSSPRT